MIERIYILESVDPVIFYGVNNSNMQLIKTLFPKLRIVARGNVMKVIGDEDESELFLKKIREVEKYCEEYNSLTEDIILDIIKGNTPPVVKQENLIIHGMNGKAIVARTPQSTTSGGGFSRKRSCFRNRTCRLRQNLRCNCSCSQGSKKQRSKKDYIKQTGC